MTDNEAITVARARADRQLAHVESTIDNVALARARILLAQYGDVTDAWAMLGDEIQRQMSTTANGPGFTAGLLAAALIRLARESE